MLKTAAATKGSPPCLARVGLYNGIVGPPVVAEPVRVIHGALSFLRQAVLCLLSKSHGNNTKNCLLNKQSGSQLFRNALLILVKSIGLLLAKVS